MLYFYVIITSNGLIGQSMTSFRNSIKNLFLLYSRAMEKPLLGLEPCQGLQLVAAFIRWGNV